MIESLESVKYGPASGRRFGCLMDGGTYYEILEVSEDATADAIRAARNRLIQEYHPDKVPDHLGRLRKDAEKRTVLINEAYAVLSDAERRAQYDEHLRLLRASPADVEEESDESTEWGEEARWAPDESTEWNEEEESTGTGQQTGGEPSSPAAGVWETISAEFADRRGLLWLGGLVGFIVLAALGVLNPLDLYRKALVSAGNVVQDYVLSGPRTELSNHEFAKIVKSDDSLEKKLSDVWELVAREKFDLNNNLSTDRAEPPMRTLIFYGTPDLVSELLGRGLQVKSSVRKCADQLWFVEGGLLRPGGLAVLRVLVKAGFDERCLTDGTPYGGLVCGVLSAKEDQVATAAEAVDFLASHGFRIAGVQCSGKPRADSIDSNKRRIWESINPRAAAQLQ